MGPPKRPLPDVIFKYVKFAKIESCADLLTEVMLLPNIPTPQMLGIEKEEDVNKIYIGGELMALKYFYRRINHERGAFLQGSYLPNRRDPDILNPPKSLSPDLKFGCISVRKFYWAVMDAWNEIHKSGPTGSYTIVGQLIWREFFYTMSCINPHFGEMERNPICINIPWLDDENHLQLYLEGKTGFPFIDAGIRQMKKEGWIHHIIRNALSMFLTRGDLWLNWEHGFNFFLKYLIDGDLSINAGNWMWISSSAFEKSLDSSFSLDPAKFGCSVDPYGKYIKKYIPELTHIPVDYIFEPWKAPVEVQVRAGCVIGKHYPMPMVNHEEASIVNRNRMEEVRRRLMQKFETIEPKHVKPSDQDEINFFGNCSGKTWLDYWDERSSSNEK